MRIFIDIYTYILYIIILLRNYRWKISLRNPQNLNKLTGEEIKVLFSHYIVYTYITYNRMKVKGNYET
jgi:hypothetical protein